MCLLNCVLGWGVVGSKSAGRNVTCVFCRAKWILPGSGATATAAAGTGTGARAGVRTAEGYLNLAAEAGIDPIRDTSTCAFLSTHLL